jgi:hypothetical protein
MNGPYDPIGRFWSRVNRNGPLPDQSNPHYKGLGRCWNWTAAKCSAGYGALKINGIQTGTHRFSYQLHYGAIAKGANICHRCDNPSCVNPAHLFSGTSSDNAKDRCAKGRSDKVAALNAMRGGAGYCPKGELHKNSKLKESQVAAIRASWRGGKNTQTSLAAQFGVSIGLVHLIVHQRIWKHVAP